MAGDMTFLLFSLGIIGTGMLAVPVLAGSAAYAVATLGGVGLCFAPMDPVKELFWSAVLSGIIAVPIMVVMMLLATRHDTLGDHVIGPRLRWLGWPSQ